MVCGRSIGDRVRDGGNSALWDERGATIDTMVVHYISAAGECPHDPFNEERILQIFCDLGVSAHYLIGRDGGVLDLVPIAKKAWHCGGSIMPEPDSRTAVNEFSVGIELVATHDSGFSEDQYAALETLCAGLESELDTALGYVGHEHVAGARAVDLGLRPEAKTDPGPLFDWSRLRGRHVWQGDG